MCSNTHRGALLASLKVYCKANLTHLVEAVMEARVPFHGHQEGSDGECSTLRHGRESTSIDFKASLE